MMELKFSSVLCYQGCVSELKFCIDPGSAFSRCMYSNHHTIAGSKIRCVILRCSSSELRIEASKTVENGDELPLIKRRNVIGMVVGVSSLLLSSLDANGAGLPPEEKPKLCDDNCEKELENVW